MINPGFCKWQQAWHNQCYVESHYTAALVTLLKPNNLNQKFFGRNVNIPKLRRAKVSINPKKNQNTERLGSELKCF